MRLLIVGTLNGQLTTATKIAMDRGATVTHATDIAQALAVLRSGRGADLLMVDVAIAIRELVTALEAEHIHAPIVACGTAPTRAPPSPPFTPAPRNTSRCRRTRN
jgi:two-component system, response regulator FlrC